MSIDGLQTKIRRMKNPSMIGIDPSPSMMPPHLLRQMQEQHGKTVNALAAAYESYCAQILSALQDVVPAVKFQAFCFFSLGGEGVSVMQRLMQTASELGFYVLLDLNFGGVSHISQLFADALFTGFETEQEPVLSYVCDAVSVNGYLGSDTVRAFLPDCRDRGKNLFVYVKTSNKSSREVQDLICGDRLVYGAMCDLLMRWSVGLIGEEGYSEIAAVVGAAYPQILQTLRNKYRQLFLLVPGYGAQGGTARNVQYAFDRVGHGAIISAARSVIGAWCKTGSDGQDYAVCARQAAEKMRDDLAKYVTVI